MLQNAPDNVLVIIKVDLLKQTVNIWTLRLVKTSTDCIDICVNTPCSIVRHFWSFANRENEPKTAGAGNKLFGPELRCSFVFRRKNYLNWLDHIVQKEILVVCCWITVVRLLWAQYWPAWVTVVIGWLNPLVLLILCQSFLDMAQISSISALVVFFPNLHRVPTRTGKMGRHFPVREKSGNFEQTGKVRENHTKYWKTDTLR